MITRTLLASICICLLSACSSLVVQVDALDRTYAEQAVGEAKLRMLNYEIARRGSDGLEKSLESLNDEWKSYMGKLADLYEQKSKEAGVTQADKNAFAGAAAGLRSSVGRSDGRYVERFESTKQKLRAQVLAVQQMVANMQWAGTDPIPADIRQGLLGVQGTRDSFARALLNETDVYKQQEKDFSSASTSAASTAREAVEHEARTILAGPTLASSEYAYIVSKAPDLYWSTNFNRVLGSAEMGNSDIVVKMNSQADFSVKGMRFDASTVAAVASKVTTQALLLGIQMAGVPLPKPATGSTNSGNGAKLADASGQLSSDQETLAKRKAKIDAWRVAMREMALSILAEESSLTASNWPQQKNIVASQLDSMFNAMQSTLKLDGLN
jgi:hypothetical protein